MEKEKYKIECVKEIMKNTGGTCGCDDCMKDDIEKVKEDGRFIQPSEADEINDEDLEAAGEALDRLEDEAETSGLKYVEAHS